MRLKTVKWLSGILPGLFAASMAAMCITASMVFGYIGIALVVIYGIFHTVLWRCQTCRKNIGPLWVKHCPECGEKLGE